MKIYFHAGQQPASGYRRIIAVHNAHCQPFSIKEIEALVQTLRIDVYFPAPNQTSLLVLSRNNRLPTIREIRKALGRCVSARIFYGGIFNPYLPVRPYDAWFD